MYEHFHGWCYFLGKTVSIDMFVPMSDYYWSFSMPFLMAPSFQTIIFSYATKNKNEFDDCTAVGVDFVLILRLFLLMSGTIRDLLFFFLPLILNIVLFEMWCNDFEFDCFSDDLFSNTYISEKKYCSLYYFGPIFINDPMCTVVSFFRLLPLFLFVPHFRDTVSK